MTGPRPRAPRGLTLLEILVVTSIMAVLMGISIGFISKLNRVVGLKAEAARVDAVLRQARNTASTDESETVVRIDPERNRIGALRWRTVGLWHFEDDRSTGFGTDAQPVRAQLTEEPTGGRFGRCFVFDKGSVVHLGNLHTYNLPLGQSFEAWVFPFDADPMVVARKGRGLSLGIEDGFFYARMKSVGEATSAERNLPVPPGRWSHVRMTFDSRSLRVYVNGALGGVYPPEKKKKKGGKKKDGGEERPGPVRRLSYEPDRDAEFLLGSERGGFRGKIDEVRLAVITDEDTQELAAAVRIDTEKTTDLEIRFAPSGRLDPAFHDKPVTIVVAARSDPDKTETVSVSLSGVVE